MSGGIVLLPTDTVYGLAVSPNNPDSVHRLFMMKCRPQDMHLPIMVASAAAFVSLGIEITPVIRRLLNSRFVPGPLTMAVGFHKRPRVPWLEDRVEVAIRIPDDKRMISVLEETGPLMVTSANRHGQPCGLNTREVLSQLDILPDLVIDAGPLHTIPSALVNCRVVPPVIEREGCIPRAEILHLLGHTECVT